MNNQNSAYITEYSDVEIEVLKILFDEWKYRQQTLWSLMTKSISFAFALIFLPLLSDSMGVNIASLRIPLFILPVAGISLSVIIAFFAINEMLRIHRIKMSIKANIKFISSKFDEALKGNKFNNFIPIAVFIVQITLAIIIIIRIA